MLKHMKRLVLTISLLVPLSLFGCSRAETGPDLYPVTGEVTFEGKAVDAGRITFRKTEGDQRAYSAEITNGTYLLEAEPGLMTVEITASRPTGKFDTSNPDDEPQPIGEMYIPAKYNSQTELKAEVAPNPDANNIPFDLKGK